MAKRKRLTPANPMFIDTPAPTPVLRAAPIADVARDAGQSAAAEELAQALTEAREGGRMVIAVPLEDIQLDYLVRDRIASDDDAMTALMDSLRARGQQTPVELTELAPGRYGLISGWRRCTALRQLHDQTGEGRFATVLALVRRPTEASEAYIAMVEENEIRVGLSYYERARIVARATERGVFADERSALKALFHAASRPRRSKIGSFLTIVRDLDGALRFPWAIPERAGLVLSRALAADAGLGSRISAALATQTPDTPEAEAALLAAALRPKSARTAPAPVAPPVTVKTAKQRITLSGPAVTPGLVEDLRAWLAARGLSS